MRACPKCGGLMLAKKTGARLMMRCGACGFMERAKPEDLEAAERDVDAGVPVIEEEAPSTLPLARVPCPKCGHDEAGWWISQTRGADEPSTRFYKCVKCGKVWREYS